MLMLHMLFLLIGLYVTLLGSKVKVYEGLNTDVEKLYIISLFSSIDKIHKVTMDVEYASVLTEIGDSFTSTGGFNNFFFIKTS